MAGFIIMAGAIRPLKDLIIEQYEYIFSLDGQLSQEENSKLVDIKHETKKIKTLKKGEKIPVKKE